MRIKNQIKSIMSFNNHRLLWVAVYSAFYILHSTFVFAQSERKLVREGYKLYKDKKFSDAEVDYKKDQQESDEQRHAQQQKPKIAKEDGEKMMRALNTDKKNAQNKLARKQGTTIQIDKQS